MSFLNGIIFLGQEPNVVPYSKEALEKLTCVVGALHEI
jgi:hypothetical protein